MKQFTFLRWFGVLTLALLFSLPARAQVATGNVFGAVTDSSGAFLPGVSVTLSGETGSRSTLTDSRGEFRFLNVDSGTYSVTATLQGFRSSSRPLSVVTGQNVSADLKLAVGGLSEEVTVSGEAPLVDPKRRGTGTTLTATDLKQVPNSRDPWGIMNQIPGVIVDRVNIAGNENGQQSDIAGKGAADEDKVFSLDGMAVTDMASMGSPSYYDFDAFQEIAITTGGGELTMATGGVNINLVTKRGTNAFHGGGRYFWTDQKFSSANLPAEIQGDPRLAGGLGHCAPDQGARRDKADHIDNIKDYGFDLGGPVIKDKLWFYGTWGTQSIQLCRLNGTPDDTKLPSINAKLNWQATSNTMVSAFYFDSAKEKFGRSPGTGYSEQDGILWNQGGVASADGFPTGLAKLEINHTFSPSFFMSVKVAHFDTGFGLLARGDKAKSFTYDDVGGTAIGTYVDFTSTRPQNIVSADASYFAAGMGGNHELKLGFGYRVHTTNSATHYNGNQIWGIYAGPTADEGSTATIARDGVTAYTGRYGYGYLGDTLTRGNWTFNAGARLDFQTTQNDASESPANASFGNLLPALEYAGDAKPVVKWVDVSPRFGLSYAIGEDRRTVLRASFSRYAAQLQSSFAQDISTVNVSTLTYGWNDLNGDRFPQSAELDLTRFVDASNVDPRNPAALGSSPNRIDKDFKSKKDTEFILGLDHELRPSLAVGASLTYRRASGWDYFPRLGAPCPTSDGCRIISPSEYSPLDPVTRSGYTAQPFSPDESLYLAGGAGRYRTNRDGYRSDFKGFDLTLNKRLANRWAARVAFAYNDWTDHFAGQPFAGGDASPAGSPVRTDENPGVDGGQTVVLGGASGKAVFYGAYKWQIFASALAQLPVGLEASASLIGRQGGVFPVTVRSASGLDGTLNLLAVPSIETERLGDLWNLDLRLAKNVRAGRATLALTAELFNALNNDLVLGRSRNAASTAFRRVDEVISPRILRLGARLSF